MADKEESIETIIDTGNDDSGIGRDGLPKDELVANPVTNDDDGDIEIVDDTPDDDRGVAPLKDTASLDEELEGINDKVRERINKLRHAFHDERRRAEQAERERQAALQFAEAMKGQLSTSRVQSVEGTKNALNAKIAEATARYAAAKEKLSKAGDHQLTWEEVANLQDQMTESKFEVLTLKRNLEAFEKMALQQQPSSVQSNYPAGGQVPPGGADRQQPPVPAPDPALRDWMKKNPWFGSTDAGSDEADMTAVAMSTHERLVRQGINPRTEPDKYYTAIDKRLRQLFPSYDWPDKRQSTGARSFSNVAKGSRSTTSTGGKVRLTQSQVAIAKKLGVPLKEYAKQVQLLESNK